MSRLLLLIADASDSVSRHHPHLRYIIRFQTILVAAEVGILQLDGGTIAEFLGQRNVDFITVFVIVSAIRVRSIVIHRQQIHAHRQYDLECHVGVFDTGIGCCQKLVSPTLETLPGSPAESKTATPASSSAPSTSCAMPTVKISKVTVTPSK
ncbi:MAG: hypothetical protein R3F47_02025 [Gammaproteobacteria bacterium]